ncbi:UDP-2,3-diacylglucosamine diphosphatase [Rhodobacter sp. Har01]|uniref:UDP-2,3-diacylglucosamine diphosphatase n=1 Tax=Rhodobacter sp. Har01 TaxID=2883999 RepID=UPI001D0948F0|nr:UDP-2,3-diacylglucosamine diphosphatase [Rhodobacter sp. Har01]MCB6179788.1 UDP-2,3-diacylglucosamine diphosphatase [Rhodobacter sp. Har01]
MQPGAARRRRLRSLFVSDLHLGSGGARASEFLEFLCQTDCATIYLVGDIFDIWHVGRVVWSPAHDAILADLAARAAKGTRVVYLPGNHDAAMRNFVGLGDRLLQGAFELHDSMTHVAADGRRYLVLHGDQCDSRFLKWHLLTRLGSRIEAALRRLDRALLRATGSPAEQGLLDLLRQGVNALVLIGNGFEQRLVRLARDSGHDGVICGHYHRAALRDHGRTAYANCGDWVDSLTALGETEDGSLQLLEWAAEAQVRAQAQECAA